MSDTAKLNPFASTLNPLAHECQSCVRKRELVVKAQEMMDEVHRGKRVFLIPPVKCTECDEGLILTPLGQRLALLMANFVREQERLAKEPPMPF